MMPDAIAYRVGTFRAAGPEQTWARVAPMLPRFGITRVADITRLDDIGLPVHVAFRPDGLTLAVSIGSGATAVQSRVSAVMESIEAWHAENLRLPVAARAPAAALDLGYDVRALNLAARSPLTADVVLDWVAGRGLLTGREVLAPVDLIRLDRTAPDGWADIFFQSTSNGLATGNTFAEAVLHGLHEVIERDAIISYMHTPASQRRYVDPASCAHPLTRQVHDALAAVGCTVVLCEMPCRIGVPCYAAAIWSPDVPLRCGGFGCHVEPAIALGRAMAEAAQSRMAAISGARDDIDGDRYDRHPPLPDPGTSAYRPQDIGRAGGPDLESVIRHCASLVAAVTGAEPFVVRLDHEDLGIPAVKVIAPGLRLMDTQLLSRMDLTSSFASPQPAAPDRAPAPGQEGSRP
jgi:YcaO-like protein with predicted kinase domain